MNLSLIMAAGAIDQPVRALENSDMRSVPRQHQRGETSQQASAKNRDARTYPDISHVQFISG
jgi:hypothetical protein